MGPCQISQDQQTAKHIVDRRLLIKWEGVVQLFCKEEDVAHNGLETVAATFVKLIINLITLCVS